MHARTHTHTDRQAHTHTKSGSSMSITWSPQRKHTDTLGKNAKHNKDYYNRLERIQLDGQEVHHRL